MKYKHIIFDIDGTLIDTEKAVLLSLQETLKELQNRHLELEDLRFCLGIPGETALKQLGIENAGEVNILWNEHLKNHFNIIKPFPGIKEVIITLVSKGFKLGLITSKNRSEYAQDFLPFGLAQYFDLVVCMEDSESPKPSPFPMLKYLENAGITSNEAVYIGDTSYDIQCAKGAGVDFALALWGCNSPDHIKAQYYFNSPGDIISIL